jgi:hypothetical protein
MLEHFAKMLKSGFNSLSLPILNAFNCNKLHGQHKYFPLTFPNQIQPLYHRDFCVAKKINQMPSVWSDYRLLHPSGRPHTIYLFLYYHALSLFPEISPTPAVNQRRKIRVG